MSNYVPLSFVAYTVKSPATADGLQEIATNCAKGVGLPQRTMTRHGGFGVAQQLDGLFHGLYISWKIRK